MIEIIGQTGTLKLGIAGSALICDVRTDAGWVFRRSRDRQIRELINMVETHHLAENRHTHTQDVVLWHLNETDFCKHLSTSETWQTIRTHRAIKDWSKVVWFSLGVPQFAFITWMEKKLAVHRRLYASMGSNARLSFLWRAK